MKDKSRDRELGMDRPITRRDFLNGVALTVGGAAGLAGGFDHRAFAAVTNANPPALAGLRGHSEAAMNVMHSIRDGTFWDKAPAPEPTGETLRPRRGRRRHIGPRGGVALPAAGRRAGKDPDPREQ